MEAPVRLGLTEEKSEGGISADGDARWFVIPEVAAVTAVAMELGTHA
jgi:hypothetical protein